MRLVVPTWVVLAVSLFGVLIQGLSLTGIGASAEQLTTRRFLYHLRAVLSPPIVSPKLKIFSFDDRTAAGIGDFDLGLREWADLITAVNARDPRKIYIDKLFDKPQAPEAVAYFREKSALWADKLSVISFVRDTAIPFRENIGPAQLKERLNRLIEPSTVALTTVGPSSTIHQPMSANRISLVYGAHKSIQENLGIPGHAVYDGDGTFRPLFAIGEGLHLPHVGLTGAEKIEVSTAGVFIGRKWISPSVDAAVPINFGSKDEFKKSNYSLLPVINRVRQGLEISVIEKGDSVLLLPAMYTGNTDWRETPFGSIPGGQIVASIINSQLTDTWLLEIKDPGFLLLLLVFAIFLAGSYLPTVRFIYSSAGLAMLWLLAASGFFVFGNILIPVLWPLSGIFISGAFWVAYNAQRNHTSQTRIRAELDAATKVQATFIPEEILDEPGFKIRSFSTPASECGGDWWGYRMGADGARYLFIGDAVGHGIPAALVTAVSFAVSETLMLAPSASDAPGVQGEQGSRQADHAPPQGLEISRLIMERLNTVLLRLRSDFAQMTFQIIRIDPVAGSMQVLSAAHTFPIIYPASTTDSRLKKGHKAISVMLRGNFLGGGDDLQVGSSVLPIRSGDRIVIYTDGVIENQSLKNSKAFGRQGLQKTGERHAAEPFDSFFAALKNAYFEHVHGSAPADDATLVAIEYKPTIVG